MQADFECEHTIKEWQIGDIEGGIVNVGQSFQSGIQRGKNQGGITGSGSGREEGSERMGNSDEQHAQGEPESPSSAGSPSSGSPSEGSWSAGPSSGGASQAERPHPLPTNLSELVTQVQWLQRRVMELENQLQSLTGNSHHSPSRVEFKIQKLYVRELSGTLNIGVTSINDQAPEWVPTVPHIMNEKDDDWKRLEQEGDEDWFTDVSP